MGSSQSMKNTPLWNQLVGKNFETLCEISIRNNYRCPWHIIIDDGYDQLLDIDDLDIILKKGSVFKVINVFCRWGVDAGYCMEVECRLVRPIVLHVRKAMPTSMKSKITGHRFCEWKTVKNDPKYIKQVPNKLALWSFQFFDSNDDCVSSYRDMGNVTIVPKNDRIREINQTD